MKIKLILGFRRDQEHSIDISEAHKAYWLFRNPEGRTIFDNGLALIGSDIKSIVPDYQGSMNWNPNHLIDSEDMNEIRKIGLDRKLRDMMSVANKISENCTSTELNKPLQSLLESKYVHLLPGKTGEIQNKSFPQVSDLAR